MSGVVFKKFCFQLFYLYFKTLCFVLCLTKKNTLRKKSYPKMLPCCGQRLSYEIWRALNVSGVSMGRIRVHHKPDPSARVRSARDGPLLQPPVHKLHDLLHPGTALLHADTVRRLPAHPNQRAHGRIRYEILVDTLDLLSWSDSFYDGRGGENNSEMMLSLPRPNWLSSTDRICLEKNIKSQNFNF